MSKFSPNSKSGKGITFVTKLTHIIAYPAGTRAEAIKAQMETKHPGVKFSVSHSK
jgi:hypothetical protein